MLDLNPENVFFIIEKAKEFQTKEAVTIPEVPLSPADDWATQVLADHIDDPAYAEAVNAIEDLDPDQQVQLVALMWMGRGDFELDDWQLAIDTALSQRNERTAEYLLSTPLVASYLEQGLEMHGYEDERE